MCKQENEASIKHKLSMLNNIYILLKVHFQDLLKWGISMHSAASNCNIVPYEQRTLDQQGPV